MERRWGIESHVLGANELRDLAPALADSMVGADFVPAEGYGDHVMHALGAELLGPRRLRLAPSALAGIGAIRDQVIPPTANLLEPDAECDLDHVVGGRTRFHALWSAFQEGFAELHFAVNDLVAEGNRVVARLMTGGM